MQDLLNDFRCRHQAKLARIEGARKLNYRGNFHDCQDGRDQTVADNRLTSAKVDRGMESASLVPVQQVESLNGFLSCRMPEALEMLRQMVGINSYTGNREGVNRTSKAAR